MSTDIKSELHGATLVVSFNRPRHANALTPEMAAQLLNVLKPATTDRGIRAVLLRGEDGNFMDGLDMELYAGDFGHSVEHANQMILPYHSAVREIQAMEKPVLAAVEGKVSGPGFSLMLACDLVLAARNTQFKADFAAHGTTPDGGCSHSLTRRAGTLRANEILMLDEAFDAVQAERWGLVNRVVEDWALQQEAHGWLEQLAQGPTRSYGSAKRLVLKAFEQDMNAQLSLEHNHWGAAARSFDFREAIKAHFAGRPAKFTGT